MTAEQWERVKELFHAAIALPDAGRMAFARASAAGDEQVFAELSAMLASHQDEPEPLSGPPGSSGDRVGPYRVIEQIGEGGMGVVFMAEQEVPVRRRVALKIIRPGLDSHAVIARFEAERQALAMMDHPNIARIYDAAVAEDGRPYFAMELVDGLPITSYCDRHRLTLAERLGLFVSVCQAVQHAHQKGIIHRDLKPSNILVSVVDGKPVAKVIDFGIAKALHERLTDKTMATRFGAAVGTLEYMSPEQTDVDSGGADTRSDVYSLGVVLYELLTGATPLDGQKLRELTLARAIQAIRQDEPPKPSTRLASSGMELSANAALRQTDPAKLIKAVSGDLDWIAVKCLEKERSRRYDSASGLARDVERYLADEPVEASPPSAIYRVRKLARKYRVALRVAAIVLVTLIAATVVSSWQAVRATHAKHAAQLAEQRITDQRNRALAEKARADRQAAITDGVNKFLKYDLLGQAGARSQASAGIKPSRDLRVVDALDRAARLVKDRFGDQPEVEASVRNTIGKAYLELGEFEKAREQFETALPLYRKSLGEEHVDTLIDLGDLGVAYLNLGKFDAAERLLREHLEKCRRLLGTEHRETLIAMANLALLYDNQGKYRQAEGIDEEVLATQRKLHGDEDPETLGDMNNLGAVYQKDRKLPDAERLISAALRGHRKVLGNDHPVTLLTIRNLAIIYLDERQYAKAEPLFQEALAGQSRVLGDGHFNTLVTMRNFAGLYWRTGRHAEAQQMLLRARDLSRQSLGELHPLTLATAQNLAMVYEDRGEYQKADELYEQVVAGRRKALGDDHPDTLTSLNNWAILCGKLHRYEKAEALLLEAVARGRKAAGDGHPDTLKHIHNLAVCYLQMGRPDRAEPLFIESLQGRRRALGDRDPDTLLSLHELGKLYLRQGRTKQAEPLLKEAYAGERSVLGERNPDTLETLRMLTDLPRVAASATRPTTLPGATVAR